VMQHSAVGSALSECHVQRGQWQRRVQRVPHRPTDAASAAPIQNPCCKRRLKSAAGGARKVLHPPGKADWI
jgi:hypothetical protein